ncbi:hypothetical protein TUBRATIS_18300 [Tubulinosema ratisbonensis]|uniref:Transmembrane protein n=1 Tax=Tubulinosema ratisbonensis TaxID=291195 RepID=A0A437AKI9_9MICR|nr:hypothetical protein TUBRATIS_18300 [Tubulinosema ratisbonensis]
MPSNINQFSEQEIRHQETEITYDKEFIYTILIDRSINFILLMLIILQMFLFNKPIPQIFTIFILFLAMLLCYIIQSKRISFLFKFLDSYQQMLYILFCLIDFIKLYNYFLILEHFNFLFMLRFFSDLFVTLCLIFWVLKMIIKTEMKYHSHYLVLIRLSQSYFQ